MSHALERAAHYRDLAKRYLRLAASTESPNHYLRIAVQYNALAEAEEGSADGVVASPMSEGPSVFAFSHLFAPMALSAPYPRPRRTGTGLER
jgi:hypothetical protein